MSHIENNLDQEEASWSGSTLVPGSLSSCEPIEIAGIMRLTELATYCGIIIYSAEQWFTFEIEKYRNGRNLEESLKGDATELIEETH